MIVRSRDDKRRGDARVESETVANSASFARGHGRGVHDHRCRAEGRRLGLDGFPRHQSHAPRDARNDAARRSRDREHRLPAQHAGALAQDGVLQERRHRDIGDLESLFQRHHLRDRDRMRAARPDGVSLRYAGRSRARARRRPIAASEASRRHHPRAVAGPAAPRAELFGDRRDPLRTRRSSAEPEVRSSGRREPTGDGAADRPCRLVRTCPHRVHRRTSGLRDHIGAHRRLQVGFGAARTGIRSVLARHGQREHRLRHGLDPCSAEPGSASHGNSDRQQHGDDRGDARHPGPRPPGPQGSFHRRVRRFRMGGLLRTEADPARPAVRGNRAPGRGPAGGADRFPRWRTANDPARRRVAPTRFLRAAAMNVAVAAPDRGTPFLQARGVKKHFGGAQALRGVDFTLYGGEVHALLGENGAGKTTLMNILSGVHAPDDGEITIAGQAVRFEDPREAQAAGIATIYQELDLVPSLSVAANLFLGREIVRAGRLDEPAMRAEARHRLSAIDVEIDIARKVEDLSIGHRQVVAIVKALSNASRILIMDEPTAALTSTEAERLFKIMRDLSAKGVGIIYISHRLEEVPRVADRVTVLRDGLVAGEAAPNAPQAELVRLLVGRPLGDLYPKRAQTSGRRLLNLDRARFRLRRERAGWQPPQDVTLSVHAGEIVGLAGVMGAGRTELLSALYGTGLSGGWQGVGEVNGKPARLTSVRAARRAGLAFVTDDRRGGGLMLRMPVGRNLVMSILDRISPFGFMSGRMEADAARRSFDEFDIRPRDARIAAGSLSGGHPLKK